MPERTGFSKCFPRAKEKDHWLPPVVGRGSTNIHAAAQTRVGKVAAAVCRHPCLIVCQWVLKIFQTSGLIKIYFVSAEKLEQGGRRQQLQHPSISVLSTWPKRAEVANGSSVERALGKILLITLEYYTVSLSVRRKCSRMCIGGCVN